MPEPGLEKWGRGCIFDGKSTPMKIRPYAAIIPNEKLISSPDSFFGNVKHNYTKYVRNGFFRKTEQEAFYVYQIKRDGKRHLGLLVTIDIEAYLNGKIKVHENTLAEKEQKTTDLIMEREAMIKPVMLGYPGRKNIEDLLWEIKKKEAPFYKFSMDDGALKHKLYRVSRLEDIQKFKNFFAEVDSLYIADGHHRTSTSANLYEMQAEEQKGFELQWLHAGIFAFEHLEINDYNRVVKALRDMDAAEFVVRLSAYFEMELLSEGMKPSEKFCIHMYLNDRWYRLKWRKEWLIPDEDSPVLLDAALFDHYVLGDIIGIENVRNDDRVSYVEGPKGIEGVVNKTEKSEERVGFCLPAVSTEEFIAVSDARKTLPPKSTWFEPRLKNGIIVQALTDFRPE
jgi:uncharacterized protein (DUF1015 family)